MGLVKTRRLAAMQKQQRAKAGDAYEVFAQDDVWEGRPLSIAQAGQRAYFRPAFDNLSSQFANCELQTVPPPKWTQ